MQIAQPQKIRFAKKSASDDVKKAFISRFIKPRINIQAANEETLKRLNELAGKQPFCTWFKGRKNDPL